MTEREIKLKFRDPIEARAAVLAAGATPLRGRRLQEDCLLDTRDGLLHKRRCVLRVRLESGKSLLTFKGPVQISPVNVREECETVVSDGFVLLRVFEELGFQVWFRYQKYREEFASADVIVAVDETPVGTFVEIEGTDEGIAAMTQALSRTPDEYLFDSYRTLFAQHCEAQGIAAQDMVFEEAEIR